MQQRVVINNGKRYLINVATNDDGIGAGFAVGQLVMKSYTDNLWYILTASGSAGSVAVFVSQSALPFQSGSSWKQFDFTASSVPAPSYYEQNYPYQIIAADDGLAYQVFITGSAPSVSVFVSQSALYTASVTLDNNAVIDRAKPYLLLQNITNGDYYRAYLWDNAGTIELAVDQTVISQSWVKPIF